MNEVIGVAVLHGGALLAARRTAPHPLAGLWELPGGKVEPGETAQAAAERELAEELGIRVEVTGWLDGAEPVRDDLVLRVALARLVEGDPVPTEHDAVRWLRVDQLDDVTWSTADVAFVEQLRVRMSS